MAKVTLNATIIGTITGRSKASKWSMKAKYAAQLKQLTRSTAQIGQPLTNKHSVYDWPTNPDDPTGIGAINWKDLALLGRPGGRRPSMIIYPPDEKAECLAWRVLDAAYQTFPPEIRATWRRNANRPRQSGYDTYMKHAIPHVLRGLPVAPWINPLYGMRTRRLTHLTANQLATFPAKYTVMPFYPIRNAGLSYVQVGIAHGTPLPGTEGPPRTWVKIYTQQDDIGLLCPGWGWLSFAIYDHLDGTQLGRNPDDTLAAGDTTADFKCDGTGTWITVDFQAIDRDGDGIPIIIAPPHAGERVLIQSPTPLEPYKTWPRKAGTTRRPARSIPDSVTDFPPVADGYAWVTWDGHELYEAPPYK